MATKKQLKERITELEAELESANEMHSRKHDLLIEIVQLISDHVGFGAIDLEVERPNTLVGTYLSPDFMESLKVKTKPTTEPRDYPLYRKLEVL